MQKITNNISKYLAILTFGIFLTLPTNYIIAMSDEQKKIYDSGIYYYDVGNNKDCSNAIDIKPQENGVIYILGDSIIEATQQQLTDRLKTNGYNMININASQSRGITAPGQTNDKKNGLDAIKSDSEKIKKSGEIVIELGTNGGDTTANIDKLIKEIRKINATANISWVNVGVANNATSSDKASMKEANINLAKKADKDNYKVIDWYKKINNSDSDGLLEPDGVHPNAKGQKALANLINNSVGSGSNSGNAPTGSSNVPFKIPADKGYMGYEDPIDASGHLTTDGSSITFPQFAKLGKEYRDYYIAMRWTYSKTDWNGNTQTVDNAQLSALGKSPHIVLVTNTRNHKSIYAAAIEFGPGPSSGASSSDRALWNGYVLGTPEGYGGRVSGLPPVAYKAIDAQQRTTGKKDGDLLTYQWAPDQNVKPGPTDKTADVPGSSPGNCSVTSGGTILEIVQKYAWEDGRDSPTGAKDDYVAATEKALKEGKYTGAYNGGGKNGNLTDCGGFVTRVIQNSVDPDYNNTSKYKGPSSDQMHYAEEMKDKYTALGPQKDTTNLQPGDIAIINAGDGQGASGHTFIYTGKISDSWKGNGAQASLGSQVPNAMDVYFNDNRGEYAWFRHK